MKKQRQRRISFIVVLIFIVTLKTFGQENVFRNNEILPAKNLWNGFKSGDLSVSYTRNYPVMASFRPTPVLPSVSENNLQRILPADFYVQHIGYFCKKEWEFEKSVHIPLRFRLGSLEYCNYLEGKK
ncbi:MAG TPA: hypothetical protein VMI12_02505 [Puia sp.]|nr:hypothetical protein [Puia sp.]